MDLRQLPQVEENGTYVASTAEKSEGIDDDVEMNESSPIGSPKKDWNEVKEKEAIKKTPSKLDIVRAKLAEATRVKDRLGRPLLFSKSPSTYFSSFFDI